MASYVTQKRCIKMRRVVDRTSMRLLGHFELVLLFFFFFFCRYATSTNTNFKPLLKSIFPLPKITNVSVKQTLPPQSFGHSHLILTGSSDAREACCWGWGAKKSDTGLLRRAVFASLQVPL